ncbi:universal stress protein [Corynebacterium liangguodongii]|uniref:UspA domain-containing protein n=1 Tax=Corynebacterium liangguodongii TaxID=2079535 RepID=A0A2S0WGQ4_9CORY|nr:universal stress protein [Corynebacterium liangguodongii]AWB84904.1 hypothetical protein C3E79_10840 [Corynebacterium liangguodongii]PWB99388.1 universal stress protein [Corynebacterium liangguodongii]
MSLSHYSPDLAWAVDGDSPLRAIAIWKEHSDAACEVAGWLGKSLPVTVQAVAAAPSAWKSAASGGGKKAKKLRREAEALIAQAEDSLQGYLPGAQVAGTGARIVASLSGAHSLVEAVDDFDAGMIFVDHEAYKSKGMLIDATARPLVIAPRGPKLSKKGVTRVTYVFLDRDGFAHATGLAEAGRLAARIGVPLRLLAVLPECLTGSDFDANINNPKDTAAWFEEALGQLDLARDLVFEASAGTAEDLDVELDVASGRGWKHAVNSVKWKKGDLACLAFRPKNQLKRVFSGPLTSEFLRYCPAPTLIVPLPTA